MGKATMSGKRAVVVLGMHRSGTSALTRVLSLAGAELPRTMMRLRAADNPTGFWESVKLMEIHDAALEALGSAWDDLLPVAPSRFRTAAAT